MPGLNFQKYSIPLAGQLDTKSAAATVAPTDMVELENAEYTKAGNVRHRAGYTSAVLPPNSTSGNRASEGSIYTTQSYGLASVGQELLQLADNRIFSYSEQAGEFTPTTGPYCPGWHTETEVTFATENQGGHTDMATTHGLTVYAWSSGGSVKLSVVDAETGAPYAINYTLASGAANYVSLLPLTGGMMILWANSSTNNLQSSMFIPAQVGLGMATACSTPANLATDLSTTDNVFAVCRGGAGDGYLVYATDGTGSVSGTAICSLSSAGVILATEQLHATSATTVSVAYHEELSYVAGTAYAGGDVYTSVRAASTLGTLIDSKTTTVANVKRVASGAYSYVFHSDAASATENFVVAYEVDAGDDSDRYVVINNDRTARTIRHCSLASEGMWLPGGRVGFLCQHESRTGLQSSLYLVDDQAAVIGLVSSGTAVQYESEGGLPHTYDGSTLVPFKRRVNAATDTTPVFQHKGCKRIDWNWDGDVSAVELGNSAYIGGNQLWQYDGYGPVEAGFHMFPDMLDADITEHVDASGQLINGSTYSWRVYYEWYAANGERTRSAALTITHTMGATGYVDIDIPTLAHTNKSVARGRSAVAVTVYRCSATDNTYFYRVSSSDPSQTGLTYNMYLANSTTADTVTFKDRDIDDTELEGYEIDYLSNGELAHFEAPAARALTVVNSRIFAAGGALPKDQVHVSKDRPDGRAAEFTGGIISVRVGDSGPITALASVDDVPVVFKDRTVYRLPGDGVGNTGVGNGYIPERVQADRGCVGPRAVVSMPDGAMYASSDGVYLVGRDMSVTYIGSAVEDYNDQTYTSACVIPDTTQVYFTTADGSTLAYDYFYRRWATFTNHEGKSAAVWGRNKYAYLRNDDEVFVRDVGAATDAGNDISMRLRTGSFRVDSLQSWFKVNKIAILGEYVSTHRLLVKIYRDRDVYPIERFYWNPDDVLEIGTLPDTQTTLGDEAAYLGGDIASRDYQFSHRPILSKYQQISFEFQTQALGTPGACCELTEILISAALLDAPGRQAPGRKL